MAATSGNDISLLQATDIATVSLGAGNDRYILDAALLSANQKITISDSGANTLQLTGGLVITSAQITATAIKLVLNNGAEITLLGADEFTFLTGGNNAGTGGLSQTFAQFVTASLGVAGGVPAVGAAAVTSGSVTVNATGGTGAVVPPVVVGQTFTLTNGVDNIVGTANNDKILAGTENATATLNAGDQIDGGQGMDSLEIYAGAANFAATNVSNVEVINVYEDASLNVALNAGVQQAWSIGGASKTITANLTQTIGFGNIATGGAGVATFIGAGGSADAATVALKDAGKIAAQTSLAVAGIEALTLNVTGKNEVTTLTAVNAAKVVITGAGSLKTALSNHTAYKTIDGSAATGDLNIDASAASVAAQVLSIKTGAGNDTYTTLAAQTNSLDKIDLGTGANTLGFGDALTLSTGADAAKLAGVTNYQALMVTGAGNFTVNGDVTVAGVNKFVADTTGVFAGTNVKAGTTVEIGDVALSASTVAMKLGDKILNLDLAGTKTAISDATAGVTVTGATNVNIASKGTVDQGSNVLVLTSDANSTLTITGTQGLTLTTTAGAGTTGFTIDGSAASGKLDLTGTNLVDVVKGGSGADTLRASLAGGADTLTGGAGADKFIFSSTDVDTTAGAVTATITDFVSGSDSLQFGFGAGAAASYIEAVAPTNTLTALLVAADAALTGAVKYYVGQVGADSYVVTDSNGAGYTDVVKLTGVTLDQIAATDITA